MAQSTRGQAATSQAATGQAATSQAATSRMNRVFNNLRNVLGPRAETAGDGALLHNFVRHGDERAFETIVHRHGAMVMGVCRRVLTNAHDAEDAFQATFLVLMRKAGSLASPDLLANWLYGVAYNTALKARAWLIRRRRKEQQVTHLPDKRADQPNSNGDLWNDLGPVLDDELSRLPDRYRIPIILCDLEGKSRKEAAQRMRCPEGTVSGRLSRARKMLAKRLARRGVALTSGTLAALLAEHALAGVPHSVAFTIVKAAACCAAGKAATAGAVSTKVVALAEGVLRSMIVTKCKVATALLLMLAALGYGGHGFFQALAGEPAQTTAKQESAKQENAKPENAGQRLQNPTSKTAKGEDDGKLTLPLGPAPSQALVSIGESGQLTVRTRETGYQVVQGQLGQQVMRMDEIKSRPYKLEEVQAFDMNIEPVDPKRLPKLLDKEIPALVVYGRQPLDQLHFRLYKEGTLVFVLPQPAGPVPPQAMGGFAVGGFAPALPAPPVAAGGAGGLGGPVLPPAAPPKQAAPQKR